jgi:hypothetical protein
MQNVFIASNFNMHFKNENISANLPCRNNAECFRRACFAVLIETAGGEPRFPDENATVDKTLIRSQKTRNL